MASCILLGIILGALGALGGGGFWAYKTFIAKPPSGIAVTSESSTPPPATPTVVVNPPQTESPTTSITPEPPQTPSTIPPSIAKTEPPPPIPDPQAVVVPPPIPPSPPIPDPQAVVAPPPIPPPPIPEPVPPPTPIADADPVVKQEPIQSFPENAPEVASLKADADRRIDEAPGADYSDDDKAKVREAIRVAKRLTRVATLQFASASTKLGKNETNRFKAALQTQEMENLLLDPQAVFFTIGYADASGTSEINRQISQKRAAGVEAVLKSFKVTHKCYSVGIGTTTLISAEKQAKNRAVEVWVVLP